MKNGERKKMVEELEKVDYETYKETDYKLGQKNNFKYPKGTILVKCRSCKNCQRIKHINKIWRGYCEKCNRVLVADNKLTNNCKTITWQDYEFDLRVKELESEIYNS